MHVLTRTNAEDELSMKILPHAAACRFQESMFLKLLWDTFRQHANEDADRQAIKFIYWMRNVDFDAWPHIGQTCCCVPFETK